MRLLFVNPCVQYSNPPGPFVHYGGNRTFGQSIFGLIHIIMTTKAIILFVLISQTAFSQSLEPDKNSRTYFQKYTDAFIQSIKNGKPEMIEEYLTTESRVMAPFQKTVVSKANAILYYQAFAKQFLVDDYISSEIEVLDLGTRFIQDGTFTMKLSVRTDKRKIEFKGKYMNVWEKRQDGKHMLIAICWNPDERSDFGDLFRFNSVPVFDVALAGHTPINNNISLELAAYNRLQETVISEGDSKVWAMYYSDDVILLSNNGPLLRGRKEVDEYMHKHVKDMPTFEKLAIRNDRIDVTGNYIIEFASHIAIVRDGDWSGTGLGKDIRVWRREKEGYLKIIRGIGAYD